MYSDLGDASAVGQVDMTSGTADELERVRRMLQEMDVSARMLPCHGRGAVG